MKQRIKKKAPEGYYSVEDIMRLMGVSRRQVFYYFSQYDDKLPKVQIKHKNYVPYNLLDDWLVRNTGKNTNNWLEKFENNKCRKL